MTLVKDEFLARELRESDTKIIEFLKKTEILLGI